MSITPKLDSLILGPQHNEIRMTPEEFDSVTEYDDLYRY